MKPRTEAELEEWAVRNLSKIEKGLRFVDHQVGLRSFGRLDILCQDSHGRYVIVELKRPREIVDERIVSQLLKYRAGLVEDKRFKIGDPSEVRILCFVNKIPPQVRIVCDQTGIGIASYDLTDISFPESTLGGSIETGEQHGIFPVNPEFFAKLDNYCFYDVSQPIKWIRGGSVIVFYSKKFLVGECKVVELHRDYSVTRALNSFLQRIGYLEGLGTTIFKTLIVHGGIRKYKPPVRWDIYLQEFRPENPFYPQVPFRISEAELAWIRGESTYFSE